MNITEHRNHYFHIDGTKKEPKKRAGGQETVEEWIAKGNKPEVIQIGVGRYLSDLEKSLKRKYGVAKK